MVAVVLPVAVAAGLLFAAGLAVGLSQVWQTCEESRPEVAKR
jgi:hypothetical protein